MAGIQIAKLGGGDSARQVVSKEIQSRLSSSIIREIRKAYRDDINNTIEKADETALLDIVIKDNGDVCLQSTDNNKDTEDLLKICTFSR